MLSSTVTTSPAERSVQEDCVAFLLFEGASESSCRFSRPIAATVATVKGDVPRELIRQRCPSHAYSWVAQWFAVDTEFQMGVHANEDCTPSLH